MRCFGWSDGITVSSVVITDFVALVLQTGPAILLPQMQRSLDFDSSTAARISASFTGATFLSKLLSGPVTDRVGGKAMLITMLSLVSVTNYLVAGARDVGFLTLCFVFISFYGPVFSAQAVVIRDALQPDEFDASFRLLGITSRSGTVACSLVFSGLLRFMGWRNVLDLCATVGLAATLQGFLLVPARRCCGLIPESQHDVVPESGPIEQEYFDPGGMHERTGRAVNGDEKDKDMSETFCTKLQHLLKEEWYRWGALAMCGLTGVANMSTLISTFFAGE